MIDTLDNWTLDNWPNEKVNATDKKTKDKKMNATAQAPTLMSKRDIARRLGCSEPTVNRLLRARAISFVRVGRQVRFRESDLAEYVSRSTQEFFARQS